MILPVEHDAVSHRFEPAEFKPPLFSTTDIVRSRTW